MQHHDTSSLQGPTPASSVLLIMPPPQFVHLPPSRRHGSAGARLHLGLAFQELGRGGAAAVGVARPARPARPPRPHSHHPGRLISNQTPGQSERLRPKEKLSPITSIIAGRSDKNPPRVAHFLGVALDQFQSGASTARQRIGQQAGSYSRLHALHAVLILASSQLCVEPMQVPGRPNEMA